MTERSDSLVLFGGTGDLAQRKLYPALYELARTGRLPARVVAVAASEWTVQELRDRVEASIARFVVGDPDPAAVEHLLATLDYIAGDYRDPATFAQLASTLEGSARPLLYLAIPPSLFDTVVAGLAEAGIAARGRVVLEKPFGRDLASARELNRCVLGAFDEASVFRIDHFLGKDQVLDVLVFRLANSLLEPSWNRHHIASVQITMAESIDVEGRGSFYDEVGTLRDVVQNHLLQVLTLVAMEPPVDTSADALRDEKVKVLRAIPALDPAHMVRGQYAGYRDEDGVASDSEVETYVALTTTIESWRWAGVPFSIRAGKALAATATEVVVEFKRPPLTFFARCDAPPPAPNRLRFRIKPGGEVGLQVQIKAPGGEMVSHPVELAYRYDEQAEGTREEAYARLLDDALDGDQRLFARADGVEEAWRVVGPVLGEVGPVHPYERGTWGPAQAETLLPDGTSWHDPELADEARHDDA
ncbi:MAG: glucose-6-phosphate dehydrogenase [Nitriliruptoraceae bacterium]